MRKILALCALTPMLTLAAFLILTVACEEKKPPSTLAGAAQNPKLAQGELPGDKDIQNPEVAYNLALEHSQKREMEAAHHYLDLAQKLGPNMKYLFVKGIFYIQEGKYAQALAVLDQSLQGGAGTTDNRLAILNAQGVCLKELGRDEEALAKFREVVNTPGLVSRYEAYYNMGVIYIRQAKMTDAEAVFLKATEENPRYYAAFNKMGIVRAARGDWAGAALSFKKALDIFNTDYGGQGQDGAELHCNYGETLFQQKMYKEARAELLLVLKIAPEGPFGQRAKEMLAQLGGNG
jgi:tetratricopeptide (TPR) repeat protein